MPWTRIGDSAATYPKLMETAGFKGADERTVNEVAGWLLRCAFQSAAHMTDYRIDAGTAWMLGGSRTEELVRVCLKVGLLEEVKTPGAKAYRLLEDPEFIHIRLRKEVEWERQQRNDTRDPRLRVPVLLRDGDLCRYCGVLVMWRGKTSNRSGSLDHRTPGAAGTVATMVVACMGCNSSRSDSPAWDDNNPLLPPPAVPVFGRVTAKYLTENGHPTVENLTGETQRPARAPGAEPAPTGVRPATAACDDSAWPTPTPRAEVAANSPANSTPPPVGTPVSGSGRVGSVRVGLVSSIPGSGVDGSSAPSSQPTHRRRGRRGRRTSSTTRGDS